MKYFLALCLLLCMTGYCLALGTTMGSGSGTSNTSGSGGSGNYNPASVAITGGTINGTSIGATTSSTALFSTATISALTVTSTFSAPTFTNSLGAVTTYTFLASDMSMNVTTSNSASIAINLPQAGSAGFTSGQGFSYENLGSGVSTITCLTSTCNGAGSIAFSQGQGGFFFSDATGNWAINTGSGSGIVTSGTAGQVAYYASSGSSVSGNSSLFMSSTGSLGLGTTAPTAPFTLSATTTAVFVLTSSNAVQTTFVLKNTSTAGDQWELSSTSTGNQTPHTFSFYDATQVTAPFSIVATTSTNQAFEMPGGLGFFWNSNQQYAGFGGLGDTSLSRSGAGVLQIGTTSKNASGSLNLTNITVSGSITNSGITSDAGLTDATVCEDTTNHKLFAGSGTLGICLGTSSIRYKRDIVPMIDGLVQIEALKPVNFFYKAGYGDGGVREQYGLLAEDVVGVLPKLTGMDNEGKPNSVDLLGMVPILIKAVQQQQEEIAAATGVFPFHKCFFGILVCAD